MINKFGKQLRLQDLTQMRLIKTFVRIDDVVEFRTTKSFSTGPSRVKKIKFFLKKLL